ncbi:hypothetical protein TNCV_4316211 [Trichonephila clavipes]|nr:hypothetical protein TNCV_4316211 [Trichonephila clavipes]
MIVSQDEYFSTLLAGWRGWFVAGLLHPRLRFDLASSRWIFMMQKIDSGHVIGIVRAHVPPSREEPIGHRTKKGYQLPGDVLAWDWLWRHPTPRPSKGLDFRVNRSVELMSIDGAGIGSERMGKSHEKCRVRSFKADRTTSKRIRYGFITVNSTTLIGLNSPRKNTTLPAVKSVDLRHTPSSLKPASSSAVPTQEKFIEENVHIKNVIASAVPTQEKFIEENIHIKNATASAVPTQEKFTEENVHIKMQKISAVPTVPSSFQQALTDSWSRTAVHVSKGEKQEIRCPERSNLGETLA